MKAVIHPAYFPPVAHFVAMVHYDVIFEVSDNYQKQTYRNRTCVYSPNGKQLLTVPVKHTKKDGRQRYRDVKIEYDFNWRKQHRKTLETIYRTSPFFEYYEDEIIPFFEKAPTYLIDLNFDTIQLVCDCFQIDFPPEKTKSYIKTIPDAADLRNLSNAKKEPGITFEKYDQVFQEKHGFMGNLSSLDLLFNQGPDAVNYLSRQKLSKASTGK